MKNDQIDKEDLKNRLQHQLSTTVEEMFVDTHQIVKTLSGDIDPGTQAVLSNAIDTIAKIIVDQTFKNKTHFLVDSLNLLAKVEGHKVPLDEEEMDYHINFNSLMRVCQIISDKADKNSLLKLYLETNALKSSFDRKDFKFLFYYTGDIYLCPPVGSAFNDLVMLVYNLEKENFL